MTLSPILPKFGMATRAIVVASALAFSSLSAVAQAVTSELAVFSVEASETGAEVLEPAGSIDPGELLQYVVTYKNNTNSALSGFVVTGPVPLDTSYQASSDFISQAATFEARTADIDWSAPPLHRVVVNEAGERVKERVPAADYSEVRWVLSEALPAQSTLTAQYRTQVDQ